MTDARYSVVGSGYSLTPKQRDLLEKTEALGPNFARRAAGYDREASFSGGENVHPAELENVLADCPAIAEAAVVGVPDPRWGEAACAAVVLKPGSTLPETELIKLFENRLARYKHPRRIVFLDGLPKNAMGKVQKRDLRRLIDPQLDLAKPV